MVDSLAERTRRLAREVSAVDDEKSSATRMAADLIVFASTKRPQGKKRSERLAEANLIALRTLAGHPDCGRLNARERELLLQLASLGALRWLRERPHDPSFAEHVAKKVVDVAVGLVLPARVDSAG